MYFIMQASNLLQVQMLKKKLESMQNLSTHPCISCNEDEFAGFDL